MEVAEVGSGGGFEEAVVVDAFACREEEDRRRASSSGSWVGNTMWDFGEGNERGGDCGDEGMEMGSWESVDFLEIREGGAVAFADEDETGL